LGLREQRRLQIPPRRRAFGRRAAILAKLEQRRLLGPPRRLALLLPQLHEVAPQVAFAVEVDEAGSMSGHG
jgi:hypothetical protein